MVKCIPSIYKVLDVTPSTRKSYDYGNLNKLKCFNLELYKVQDFPDSLRVYFKSFLADIKYEFSDVNIFLFHTLGEKEGKSLLYVV